MTYEPEYTCAIEKLVLEKGSKRDKYHVVMLTTKEIAEKMGKAPTESEYRLIVHIARTAYPLTYIERANGDAGWLLHIKIRNK